MKEEKLGNLVHIIGGGTPSRKVPDYWDGDIPWVTVKDFIAKKISTAQENITVKGLKQSASNLIPAQSILMPTRMALGKVAINDTPVAINQDIKALQIIEKKNLNLNYLVMYLSTISSIIEKAGKGATVKGIKLDFLKEIKIPLPPLDDQIRIADVLTRAENLIAKRKKCIAELDDYIKSTFLDMFGDPVKNEKGWERKRIDEIADVRIGPFGSLLHAEDYIEKGIPLINPSHIINGEIAPNNSLTITPEKFSDLASYQLKLNDVVVARRGEIGRCAIVRHTKPLFCGTGSMFIRMRTNYSTVLLHHLIYSTSLKQYLESKAKGVTMKNLNSTTLGNLEVLHPPFDLQNEFAAIVEKVEAMKAKYKQSLTELENLYGSLSQRAFRGDLDLSGVKLPENTLPEKPLEAENLIDEEGFVAQGEDKRKLKESSPEIKVKIPKHLISKLNKLEKDLKEMGDIDFDEDFLKYKLIPSLHKQFTFNELWKKILDVFIFSDGSDPDDDTSYEAAELEFYENIKKCIYGYLNAPDPFLKQIFKSDDKNKSIAFEIIL
ncbi:MAG: restriction endonuclease subunit S [Leptospirales bacterium]